MFQGRKHGFYFCANSPSSNGLIGYVDLPDFNEIGPKWSSDINASKCVRLLRNSKYFSRDVLTSDGTTKIFYCPSLGWVFSQTNRNKEKAWHTLLAYYLLIDIVQSVWLCAFTCLCIQQNKKNWYFRKLQFISFTVIYSFTWFYRKQRAYARFSWRHSRNMEVTF